MKNMYKIINKKKINILQNILLTSSCSWVEPFKVSELSESNSNMIVSIKKENFMRYIYISFLYECFYTQDIFFFNSNEEGIKNRERFLFLSHRDFNNSLVVNFEIQK